MQEGFCSPWGPDLGLGHLTGQQPLLQLGLLSQQRCGAAWGANVLPPGQEVGSNCLENKTLLERFIGVQGNYF